MSELSDYYAKRFKARPGNIDAPPQPNASALDEFGTGLAQGFEGYKKLGSAIINDPIGVASSAVKGVGQLFEGGNAGVALRGMLDEASARPARFAGEMAAGLPLMLIPGGAAAQVAGKAATLTAGRATGSAFIKSLAGVTAGAGASGIVATGAAGAFADANNADFGPDEARLAFVLGGATGGMVRRADLSTMVKEAGHAVAEKFPEIPAAIMSPQVSAARVARAEGNNGLVGKDAVQNVEKISHAQTRIENEVASTVDPLDKVLGKLSKADDRTLNELFNETDIRSNSATLKKNQIEFALSEAELVKRGVPDKVRAAYTQTLDALYSNQLAVRAVRIETFGRLSGLKGTELFAAKARFEKTLPTPQRGIMPRRWLAGPNRVMHLDADGKEAVTAFASPSEARAFHDANKGESRLSVYLDSTKYAGMDADSILTKLRVDDLIDDPAGGKTARDKLAERLRRYTGTPEAALSAMMGERRGVTGYDSLKTNGNLASAIRRDVRVLNTAKYLSEHIDEGMGIVTRMSNSGHNAASAVHSSMLARASGKTRASKAATVPKSFAVNLFLSIFNTTVPILNFIAAGTLSPVHLAHELSRKFGAANAADMISAMTSVARGLRAALPEGVQGEHIRGLVRKNEREGSTPSRQAVNLDEPITDTRTKLGRTLTKATRGNTFLLRRSEYLAKRMVGAMFRDVGERVGKMTGAELDQFVHNGVSRTVGEFNKGMRPAFLEGNGTAVMDTLAVASTFQTYVLQKVMADLPLIFHTSPKLAAGYLASIVATAGVSGLPTVVPMLDYVVQTMDPDGTWTQAWEQKKLDNPLIMRGPLSALPVDMTNRITLSGPFGAGSEFGVDLRGITSPFIKAVQTWAQDDVPITKAIMNFIPSDFRNRAAVLFPGEDGEFAPVSASLYQSRAEVSDSTKLATLIFGLPPKEFTDIQRRVGAQFKVAGKLRDSKKILREMLIREIVAGTLTLDRRRDLAYKFTKAFKGHSWRTFWRNANKTALRRGSSAAPQVSRADKRLMEFR